MNSTEWSTALPSVPMAGPSRLAAAVLSSVVLWDVSGDIWRSRACDMVGRNLSPTEWSQFVSKEPGQATCLNPLVKQAAEYALTGKRTDASAELVELAPKVSMIQDPGLNNLVCWYGSILGNAREVMPACERAVSAAPAYSDFYRDGRGIARALTGNTAGAIEDLGKMAKFARQAGLRSMAAKRERWIADLNAGANPFDEATLMELLDE